MKKFKNMYILMMLLSSFTYGQETLKMFVKENKVPCQGIAPMECLQVKYDKQDHWQLFYDPIEGFDFEKGKQYVISVIRTKIQGSIPADGSSYKYKLKKIISKTSVKESKDVYNTKMILNQLNGQSTSTGAVYLTINTDMEIISGKSGCNNFTVKYTKLPSINQIQTDSPFGSRMACEETRMKLELDFTNAIKNQKFKIVKKNNKIQFKNLKNKIIMEFTPTV